MKKIILVSVLVMLISFILGVDVLAYVNILGGTSSFYLNADWLTDYVSPIEPGELEKGEYRYTFGVGRTFLDRDYNSNSPNKDRKYNATAFYSVFDTALTDKLDLNFSFNYVPEYKDEYDDKYKENTFGLILNYSIDKDKNLFFGCLDSNSTQKSYGILDDLLSKRKDNNTTLFLGTEIRGSFSDMFKKDKI